MVDGKKYKKTKLLKIIYTALKRKIYKSKKFINSDNLLL